MYKKLIADGLKRLGREDLIASTLVQKINYYAIIDAPMNLYTNHSIAFVNVYYMKCPNTGKKTPSWFVDNRIFITKLFDHIFNPKVQEMVVLHELCHVVDNNQKNDQSTENEGHGETWATLMRKLDLIPEPRIDKAMLPMQPHEYIKMPDAKKYRFDILKKEYGLLISDLVEIVS